MASSRALSLEPGRGLGPFELGALLWDVLTTLRSSQQSFPSAQVSWNSADAARGPVIIMISTPPVFLVFEGQSQRLALIEVAHSASTSGHSQAAGSRSLTVADYISYKGQPLGALARELDRHVTAKMLHRVFGPTYPSAPHRTYLDESVLSYPGVAFSLTEAFGLSRVIVTPPISEGDPTSIGEAYLFGRPVPETDSMDGDVRMASVDLAPADSNYPSSVTFRFHSSPRASAISDVTVTIGRTTSEDISVDFGPPLRTFWKEDDRLKIHAHLASVGSVFDQTSGNPYFMSYFNLGVDFLIHPLRHCVIKIILHSNIPGEVLFGRYSRCPWELAGVPIGTKAAKATSLVARAQTLLSSLDGALQLAPPIPTTSGLSPSPSPPPAGKQSIATRGKTSALPRGQRDSPRTGPATSLEPAMELDRTADVADEGLTLQKPTKLIGLKGVVMEVTETDEVETLWLF